MSTGLSISLPEEDLGFLDELNSASRSAAVRAAIALARCLVDDYAAAHDERNGFEGAGPWDAVSGDGITE